jgi:hypothetical protein
MLRRHVHRHVRKQATCHLPGQVKPAFFLDYAEIQDHENRLAICLVAASPAGTGAQRSGTLWSPFRLLEPWLANLDARAVTARDGAFF